MRTTRVPWIGQSTCLARRAMDGLALHGRAEEGDLHAVHVMLVDQHGDVAAGFEHAGEA